MAATKNNVAGVGLDNKQHIEQVEHVNSHSSLDEKFNTDDRVEDAERAPPGPKNIDEGFDPEVVRKLIRRCDFRVVPILSAMYYVSLVDRTNLSLARQANNEQMNVDLDLGGSTNHYSIATLIFFVPYIVFEIPSQLGLRYFGARWWLGSAVLAWGTVMLGMGFVKTWVQLSVCRFLLGLFESALFPGAMYLISCWYPRRSMAMRMVFFYKIASTVSSFSNPLGYLMTLADGKAGLRGWQWVFVFFGLLTMAVGILGYVFVTDFPDKASFLTPDEAHIIKTRIERDRSDSEFDPLTMGKILKYSLDWKVWLYSFFMMSVTLASYAMSYFLPMLLKGMGFNNTEQQLLGTPAHVWGLVPSFLSAWIADKYKNMRAWVIVANTMLVVLGTAMYSQLPMSEKVARYAGVFLAVGSANANVPLVTSWAQCSIRRQSKRAFYSAMIVAFGGVGGILASVTFMQTEAKKGYPTGVFFTIACQAATGVFAGGLHFYYRWQNRRADRGEILIEECEGFRYQG